MEEAQVEYQKTVEQIRKDTSERLKGFDRKNFKPEEVENYNREMSINLVEVEELTKRMLRVLNRYPVGLMTKQLAVEGLLDDIKTMRRMR
jgi:hypothetical protein